MFFLNRKFTSAIIAGGGSGSRMNGVCDNKLLYKINNIPVICHTIMAYSKARTISEIIVVVKQDMLEEMGTLLFDYNLEKSVKIILAGGDSRFKSVLIGLDSVSPKARYVAIADADRPFITPEQIDAVSEKAYETKAAALCDNVYDTIKVKNDKGFIVSTIDRNTLLAMQTPQTFEVTLYKKAVTNALVKNLDVTDDCGLLESIAYPVYPVMGNKGNIKITTPSDIGK
ncbi:MAG: IspD/TarI family cytidylyltransferase [Clostridia bacterium]